MAHELPWWPKRRPPEPDKPRVPPAGLAILGAEFDAKPFGSHGEMLPAVAPPPQQQSPGLVIEPPPWQEQLERGDFDPAAALAPQPEPKPLLPGGALAELKRQAGDEPEPRYKFGPTMRYAPLTYDPLPEPNWEAEARARRARDEEEAQRLAAEARRQLLEELLAEEHKSLESRPA